MKITTSILLFLSQKTGFEFPGLDDQIRYPEDTMEIPIRHSVNISRLMEEHPEKFPELPSHIPFDSAEDGELYFIKDERDGSVLLPSSHFSHIKKVFEQNFAEASNSDDYIEAALSIIQKAETAGTIYIGSKQLEFSAMMDTGSEWTWISAAGCTGCGGKAEFNTEQSETYTSTGKNQQVTYGKGAISGEVGEDQICIVPDKCTDTDFKFIAASTAVDVSDQVSDGLVGMMYQTSREKGILLVPELEDHGTISNNLFSMSLTTKGGGSMMTLGGFDAKRFAMKGTDIEWYGVASSPYGYWNLRTQSISGKFSSKNSKAFVNQDRYIVIDSGTTLLGMSDADLDGFKKMMRDETGKDVVADPRYYMSTECSGVQELPDLVFHVEDQLLMIPRDVYASDVGGGKCSLRIGTLGNSGANNIMILGLPFFDTYYSVFDYDKGGRLGFAPSVYLQSEYMDLGEGSKTMIYVMPILMVVALLVVCIMYMVQKKKQKPNNMVFSQINEGAGGASAPLLQTEQSAPAQSSHPPKEKKKKEEVKIDPEEVRRQRLAALGGTK